MTRLRNRPAPASLLTHVLFQPGDGIRRTGKARVNMRIPRVAVAPKFLAQPRRVDRALSDQVLSGEGLMVCRYLREVVPIGNVWPIREVSLVGGRRTPSAE